MGAKKSAPLKPPTIDLEAKNASKGAKDKKQSSKRIGEKSIKNPFKFLGNIFKFKFFNSIIFSLFGGAFLGLILAYSLALVGFWPKEETPANLLNSPADIAALEKRANKLEEALNNNSDIIEKANAKIKLLEETLNLTSEKNQAQEQEISKLNEALNNFAQNFVKKEELPEPVDLSQIEKRLTLLSDKIATIDAGANSSDASAIINSISLLREQAQLLSEELNNLKENIAANNIKITNIEQKISEFNIINNELSERLANLENNNKLPIIGQNEQIILEFENAIYGSKPYIGELAKIKSAYPDLIIDEIIENNSSTGLPSPQKVANKFSLLVPKILAAKPIDKEASFLDRLGQRALSLLAIRPLEGGQDNSPEAIIANIEKALKEQDFIKAQNLIAKLPEPMKEIAKEIALDINKLAVAQKLINSLKTKEK